MFGYIKPCLNNLSPDDENIYKAYYCGLCKGINRYYSFFSRIFLHFDCVYLYILYSALSDEEPVYSSEHCAFNPLKKKTVASMPEAAMAAAVNMLLTQGKLKDNFSDDRNIFAYLSELVYRPVFNRASERYHISAEEMRCHMANITKLEQEKTADIDEIANQAALMLASCVTSTPYYDDDGGALFNFSYNIGRWVYLIDALDDIEKDRKKNRYNPIIAAYGESFDKDAVEYNLMFSLKQASYYYTKLKLNRHKAILDNVLYNGLPGITQKILNNF